MFIDKIIVFQNPPYSSFRYYQLHLIFMLIYQIMSMKLIIFAVTFGLVCCLEPPVYNFSYGIAFQDTYIVNGTSYKVAGQEYHDPLANRERVDRDNGRYDTFCGTVLPNVSTPCSHYVINNQRWIAFTQRRQCCFCCDSDHGCGILKPDWLSDAKYLGEQTIIDANYDKWSKDGMFGYNYLWASKSSDKVPRRLDQGGRHITDYSINTFSKQSFPESVFALPQYCNTSPVEMCPVGSTCGKHRSNLKLE